MEVITVIPQGQDETVEYICLTPREAQILRLICLAYTNQKIAFRLGLTAGTVKEYLFDMGRKLGLSNRLEVFRWAMQHPEALGPREPVEKRSHPNGCPCPAIYCTAMRLGQVAAGAAIPEEKAA